jgi:hypothetical protein
VKPARFIHAWRALYILLILSVTYLRRAAAGLMIGKHIGDATAIDRPAMFLENFLSVFVELAGGIPEPKRLADDLAAGRIAAAVNGIADACCLHGGYRNCYHRHEIPPFSFCRAEPAQRGTHDHCGIFYGDPSPVPWYS